VVDAATALAAGLHRCSAGHFLLAGGCYDTRAAPRSGVCREERDGACVPHAEETTRSGQTAETCTVGTETGKCAPDHCNVQIGDSVYCSQCSNSGSLPSSPAPTNGVCSADNNECSAKANGMCTQCAQQSFMFQGGCYRADQTPGQAMCKTAADGVCTSPQTGYFIPPDATKTDQSIMACNDTTEITLTSNSKKYKGVLHCTQCNTPNAASDTNAVAATCTACEDEYFINGAACTKCHESCLTCEGGNGADKCKSCKEGYFLGAANSAAGKCIKCDNVDDTNWKGVVGCLKCTSSKTSGTPATCTECADNYYLKTDGGAASCVAAEQCNNGFFPTTDSKNKKVCVKCSATDSGGIANCSACTPIESPTTTVLVTCSACNQGKVSPRRSSCMTACPENSSEQSGACACSSGFVPSGDSCVASSNANLSTDAMAEVSVTLVVACPALLIVYLSL
ncbi:Variant-specific surface protein, partial [Giardia duodenalis]